MNGRNKVREINDELVQMKKIAVNEKGWSIEKQKDKLSKKVTENILKQKW